MRILLLSTPWISVPPTGYGGIEWVVSLLADELVDMGHDVLLFATGDSKTKAELKYVFPEGQFTKMGSSQYDVIQASEALALAGDYDIVHDHNWFLSVAFARYIKTPMLHTLHGLLDELPTMYYSHFRDACWYNAISEFQKSFLPNLNYVNTVHNAIDVHNYPYSETKDDYLILVSRISPLKGTHLAIKLAKELNERIVLIGKIDASAADYFEEEVRPHIDGEQIIYKGEIHEDEKRDLLKNAKCFVFPLQWAEPFGLVMAEAMACGTPVVTLRNGATPEVVEHGKTGFIVDTLDEMREAMKHISKIDSRVCRQHVLDNFSPEMMARNYVKNYEIVLEQHARRA